MSDPARPLVLITGGGGRIGQALSREFAAAGWQVAAPGRTGMDVRKAASIGPAIALLPRIDLLINNAGLRLDAPFLKLPAQNWDAVLETNLKGAWLCARAVLPRMQAQGAGHIVNLGSFTARHGTAGQTAYGAAKAGLLALTQSLAAEAGPDNIRVNAVLPGWMPTPFNADLSPEVHESVRRQHHLGHFNTPEQTARFIYFLHSLPHTSGQIFQLDSRPGSWL